MDSMEKSGDILNLCSFTIKLKIKFRIKFEIKIEIKFEIIPTAITTLELIILQQQLIIG